MKSMERLKYLKLTFTFQCRGGMSQEGQDVHTVSPKPLHFLIQSLNYITKL